MTGKELAEGGWTRVRHADECPPCGGCGEPYCTKHRRHYDDCPCIGPTQDDAEYLEVGGVLYGRKRHD